MTRDNSLDFKFQFISIFITTIIITSLIYNFMNKFCVADKKPIVYDVPQNQNDAKTPVIVKVGLTINDYANFDTRSNDFVFSGLIWFYYDPKLISKEEAEEFTVDKGIIKKKVPAYTYNIGDKIVSSYNIRIAYKANLYYGYFPFEDHRISFVIENKAVSTDKVIYKIEDVDFVLNPESVNYGWNYKQHKTTAGAGILKFGQSEKIKDVYYPRIVFEVDYFHFSIHFILTFLLPLFLIFLIELFSLCVDQEEFESTLLSLSIANVTGLLAYKFVIESMAPKVAYLMISDYIFFMFLSISFILFLINTVGPYLTLLQKKLLSIGLQLYVIFTFFYLFKYWAQC